MQQANHRTVQANAGASGALPGMLPRKTASSHGLRTVWKTTKAILSGVAFTLVGLVTYALLHGLISFQPQHAEGLRVWTLYSPWFWFFTVGGCLFSVYSVTSEMTTVWKIIKSTFAGLVFILIGYVLYFRLFWKGRFAPNTAFGLGACEAMPFYSP